MCTLRFTVATLGLGFISRLDAMQQQSLIEPELANEGCDALCSTWADYSFEERCGWRKCKGCDGCSRDLHELPTSEDLKEYTVKPNVHLERFDEERASLVRAAPEFKTTYSIFGEDERKALARSAAAEDVTPEVAPDRTLESRVSEEEEIVEVAVEETDGKSDEESDVKKTRATTTKELKDDDTSDEVADVKGTWAANTWHSKDEASDEAAKVKEEEAPKAWHSKEDPAQLSAEVKEAETAKAWHSKDESSDEVAEVKEEPAQLSAEVKETETAKAWHSKGEASDEVAEVKEAGTAKTWRTRDESSDESSEEEASASGKKKQGASKKNAKQRTSEDDQMAEWKSGAAPLQPYVVLLAFLVVVSTVMQ